MSNINDFPIDNELKDLVTNIIANELKRININMADNERLWFRNEISETIIENILEAITQWEKPKLN